MTVKEEWKGEVRLEQRHEKERVRVGRVWRDDRGRSSFAEWCVSISLLSDCLSAYTAADNSDLVATDTIKNTVYAKAKECTEEVSVENFAICLGKHFTSYYNQVTAAIITIVEKPWERVSIGGQPHEHGFKLGSEKHTTEVIVKKSGDLRVTASVEGLSLLKTTKSGFEGFIRDKYTMLPETRERMLATEVTATWTYTYESLWSIPAEPPLYFNQRYSDVKKVLIDTFFGPPKEGVYSPSVQSTLYQMAQTVLSRFPDVSSIQLKMPNIHFLPVNVSSKNNVIVKFEDDVFLPTDKPHGSIQASLSRIQAKIEADAYAKINKGKNILETPVVETKRAPVTDAKTTPVSEFKAPTDSVFANPADLETSDGTKLVEKSSGFMFSSAPAASTSSWPGVPVSQSTTFAEKASDEEPNTPLLSSFGAKTDDKVAPFTFSSPSFAGGSVGLKSPPPEEVKQEYTKSSLASNASDATETMPRPSVPDNNVINNMQKPKDTLGRPESLSSLPQSTSPFTVDSKNNFARLSKGSLNSTTPSSFSIPLSIIQTSNFENQTHPNSFTAIPLTKNSSNASSEATPSATATATATSSSFLAPGFEFESTSNGTPSTTVSLTPPLSASPDFKVSSFTAPSTYSTVSTTSCATDVKTSTEKQALPSNPFSAISSSMAGTGSSLFGFNAGSTSSSGSASLSQGSSFGMSNITSFNTQSMPVFGLSATSSALGTSGSNPFSTASSVFGNRTSSTSSFGSNSCSSSSFFSSSTSSNFTFGLSTISKDSNTTPSSTVFAFGASPGFGTSTGASTPSPVFSFYSAPQTQPMFGNTAVPAFGSASGGNNGNQMTMAEDSMDEDLAGPTPTAFVPVFGGGDGSFLLGSGGGDDKSTRRMIRVKYKNRGKR